MRFELSGSLIQPDPIVIKFNSNQNFDTQKYIDMGYTHFEVMCIGAGGGMGGGIDTANTGTLVRSYGGAGGGGGSHRVHGLLSALPPICLVVVGVGGAVGTEHVSNPASTTNGGDGGASSFNDTTCRASGGKGGRRVTTNVWPPTTTGADGGDGGVGNRTVAGGAGSGTGNAGTAGIPTATGSGSTPGKDGKDGTLYQNVGEGGGGGAGGVGRYPTPGITCLAATNGGRGSYNPGDTSVYGPGDTPGNDPSSGSPSIIPGGASGAKAAPVNGLPTVYGQSKGDRLPGDSGTVIIRLTAK